MFSVYEVSWDSIPNSLHPLAKKRIWHLLIFLLFPPLILILLILSMLRYFALKKVLPAIYLEKEEKKLSLDSLNAMKSLYLKSHQMIRKYVLTPDRALLKATLFQSKLQDQNTPTLLYFHGNNSLQGFGDWKWLMNHCINKKIPINLITFDYRGSGESKGRFYQMKDLLIDCLSILEWVKNELNTPLSLIHFYGASLGGALALKTKASDPRLSGFFISERSFSNFEDLIYSQAILPKFLKPLKPIIVKCLKMLGMDLNPADDLQKLQGKNLFVYHPKDPVIPYVASIAKYAHELDVFELQEKAMVQNHHTEELISYLNAETKVLEFAFEPPHG